MLNKLVGLLQGEKSSHPLGSKENLDRTLADIPTTDPSRVLLDVDNLLEDIQRYDTELSAAALRQAVLGMDDFAHEAYAELLLHFLLPQHREHNSDLTWSTLERHNRLLFEAYSHCLQAALGSNEEAARIRSSLTLCALRAIHAWVEFKKLNHFRYRPADLEWWLEAHKLVGLASRHGVISLAQAPYADEPLTRSTLHAYLSGLYLEISPLSNLVPIQMEVLHRWLQQHAGSFEFAEVPHPGTTHYISLHNPGTPTRYNNNVTPNPALRYCSTRRLRVPLVQLANTLRQTENTPDWLAPLIQEQAHLSTLVQILLPRWAEQPPERSSPRQAGDAPLRIVHGYALARRMIACSAYAKRGHSLNYRGADMENLFNELRFGRTGQPAILATESAPTDPMETLLKLETSGDKQMMESWVMRDSSANGLGAYATGLRSRNKIGGLVGLRVDDQIDWRLGIIRRITRDKTKRLHVGIETLPAPSICAQVRPAHHELGVWSQACEAGDGFADAILVAPSDDTLLLPPGLFVPGLVVLLKINGLTQHITLTEKIEEGSDWERVRFQPAEEENP